MYSHPLIKGLAKPSDATDRGRVLCASIVIDIEGELFGITSWCQYMVAFKTTEIGLTKPISIKESLPQLREMIADIERQNDICILELPYSLLKALR